MINKWLREPLLHFLLIGAALFVLYGIQNDEVKDDGRRIVITGADVNRLVSLWEKKWQRLPTDEELKGLVEAQVREEVLYREALAMGLDKDDTIVRRRLAQKIEFISSDLASRAEPGDDDLQEYLDQHQDKFAIPGLISFQQVYLNSDRRGPQADADAKRLLEELQQDAGVDILSAGDAFMFGPEHDQLSLHGVSRLFGQPFAEIVFKLPVGSWQGPIVSGYGLHLVRVTSRTETRNPPLDEVRDRVRDDWLVDQRRRVDEAFYAGLRKRYEIVIETAAIDSRTLPGAAAE